MGLAGAGALTLAGCGGGTPRLRTTGDPWKRYAGTTINFISENTAPTLAIAADLAPFKALTGIDVKITQLELSALVQRVALDFASGEGSYHAIYADPYQVLAPYHEALAELGAFDRDPDLPHVDDLGDFFAVQLDAAGRFQDRERLYALPYDAPTLIWIYRKDILAKHRGRMQDDLGFDPMPSADSTWEQYLAISTWLRKNARDDAPYGSGNQAKQHDALMNDFSGVLWGYGGDYFAHGGDVGRYGTPDPGDPLLDRPEAAEAADMYQRLVAVAHPSSTGWDWTGLGDAFGAGQIAMCIEWHEFASGFEAGDLKGKVGYAPVPRGPKRRACMYGGTGLGVNGVADEVHRRAAWLFVLWATSKRTQLSSLASTVGGGTPTRQSVYRLPEVVRARRAPSKLPNILTTDAVFEAWKPENIGLRPKIPAWNECDTTIFTQLSKLLAGQTSPEGAMRAAADGMHAAIERSRTSLARA
jgi:multiple sugar transport system substrate-binding protein